MINHIQLIALYTLVRREIVRMFRIASQVFLPPIISTLLYFIIFGTVMGSRIGNIAGANYTLFIAPGLIMMAVVNNAYANVSSSLFSARFQKSIEEMLVSPMHNGVLLLGYTIGGILRGLIIGVLLFFVSAFFLDLNLAQLPATLGIIILVSAIFSLAGFTNAILARSFDDISIIPTFVLTPLTYLGGVFYSIHMLSPFWQKLMYANPVFYMVNLLRHTMTGQEEVSVIVALSFIGIFLILLIGINLMLLKKGTGLRE